MCTICLHPRRLEIERELASGQSLRNTGKRFETGYLSLFRHKAHMKAVLVQAKREAEITRRSEGVDLLAHVNRMLGQAAELRSGARQEGAAAAFAALAGVELKIVDQLVDLEAARRAAATSEPSAIGLKGLTDDELHVVMVAMLVGQGRLDEAQQLRARRAAAEADRERRAKVAAKRQEGAVDIQSSAPTAQVHEPQATAPPQQSNVGVPSATPTPEERLEGEIERLQNAAVEAERIGHSMTAAGLREQIRVARRELAKLRGEPDPEPDLTSGLWKPPSWEM